jgi:hypothetical protein
MLYALQRLVAELGHCDPPVRSGYNHAPEIEGADPAWAHWIERWHATSTLTPRVRATIRTQLAKTGRWLCLEPARDAAQEILAFLLGPRTALACNVFRADLQARSLAAPTPAPSPVSSVRTAICSLATPTAQSCWSAVSADLTTGAPVGVRTRSEACRRANMRSLWHRNDQVLGLWDGCFIPLLL